MIESLAPHVGLPAFAFLSQYGPTRGCELGRISVKRASGGRFKPWCALYDRISAPEAVVIDDAANPRLPAS